MSDAPDTVTLLTPPGVGAIAVVRISGPGAEPALARHFAKPVPPGRRVYGNLSDADRVLDDIVVVRARDKTFDLNVHGGDWVVRSVIELFTREGLVVTRESPDDNDAPLKQEVLSHLPRATTEPGLRLLLAQESLWANIKVRAAHGEDVAPVLRKALFNRALQQLLNPPRVAIVGPANVGKSTLANQLFGRERSITADIPGTTRDWVGELANIDGLPVMLIDTPGIRATHDAIETVAIQASRKEIDQAEMIVVVIDATRPLDEQREMLTRFVRATVVINKSDRPPAEGIESVEGIHTVATTGKRVDALRRAIIRFFCGSEAIPAAVPSIWTARQRGILERAFDDVTALEQL